MASLSWLLGIFPLFLPQVKRRLDLETDHQYLAESSGPARGRGRHPGKGTHGPQARAGPLTGPRLGVWADTYLQTKFWCVRPGPQPGLWGPRGAAGVASWHGFPRPQGVGNSPARSEMLWWAGSSHRASLLGLAKGSSHLPAHPHPPVLHCQGGWLSWG